MRKIRLRTLAMMEMASRPQKATVTIDRETGAVYVRPLRKRRRYFSTVSAIAEWVVRSTIRAELLEKRRAKKAKKKVRR